MSDVQPGNAKEQLRQQTVLARFGEFALRSDDLDSILINACKFVEHGLGTELSKVVELQEGGETLLVRAGTGWGPGVVGEVTIQVADHTSEGHALKTGEPMISPDIRTETRFEYPEFLVENGVRAIANVVIIGGKGRPPFGILQVDSKEPREFDIHDISFLRSYANLIAAAVDRLRTDREVRDGEKRLRLALEAGELGSWDLDLASGRAKATTRTMQMFGYAEPYPAWSYDAFLSHVLPVDRERVVNAFHAMLETGHEWNFECRIRRANDGEIRWIEARGRAASDHGAGKSGNLLGIFADITPRKAIEDALLRSYEALEATVAERTVELVEANDKLRAEAVERERVEETLRQAHKMEAVGQLTGGLAHDFNNMLAGISGSLELIRSRSAQGRIAELERYIEAALASVGRAAALTHRLLAFSRRQTLAPRPTDMNQLINGMAELFRRSVGPSILIEERLANHLWQPSCDPNQLENALLNLVLNARDAMSGGGRLVIETVNTVVPAEAADATAEHSNMPTGEYVTVIVTDDGIGMSPGVLSRAFDPFFTTKPLGQGTGLGLSMIYGFVQQSGGHVRLTSTEGKGATATIHLPRYLGTESVEPAVDLQPTETCKGNAVVLVIEDEPALRMIVVELLSDFYTVLDAGDAQTGFSILESAQRVDLLITDVGLPGGMNGRQLADAARRERPDLKVLFITGYDEEAATSSGLLGRDMQVMTKPFLIDAFAARVGSIIAN